MALNVSFYFSQQTHTVFTWLNAAATIRHVLKIDAATIQRRPLFEGGVYYTLST